MRWLLGLLVLTAGCDVIFRIDHVEGDAGTITPPGDRPLDGTSRSELPDFCASPQIFDAFDAPDIKCAWGSANNGGLLSIHDSVMDMQLDGTLATFTGCTAFRALPFTPAGVFLVVPTTLATSTAYTKLGVREAVGTTPTLDATLVSDGTTLKFVVSGQQVGQSTTQKYTWWRIDQETPGVIAADVSFDGMSWTNLATMNIEPPVAINVDIGAGFTATQVTSGMATFATFGVCN